MPQFINNNRYSICKLDKTHQRQQFSCGVELLDSYLHKRAGQDNRRPISIIYILNDMEHNHIAGYYTLSSTAIELLDLPETLKSKLPQYPLLPATLIGRLAVDLNYQKQNLGELLLIDALKRAYYQTKEIASWAVIVEAINDNAIKFYVRYGFALIRSNKSKLFLPMESIEKLLGADAGI